MTCKKLALFVEGQTEQLFMKAFLEEVAGAKNIEFQTEVYGPSGSILKLRQATPGTDPTHPQYFALLVNCQNDERVKSVVLDQRASLSRAGYSMILGLRDLFPIPLSKLESVKMNLRYGVPTSGVPTHILLAVAEVEAWFLQEASHFTRIDERLNTTEFRTKFGFDPENDSAELVERPAEMLHMIYSSVGKAYKKKKAHVERTVQVLDYATLYLRLPTLLPHLAALIGYLEGFFCNNAPAS